MFPPRLDFCEVKSLMEDKVSKSLVLVAVLLVAIPAGILTLPDIFASNGEPSPNTEPLTDEYPSSQGGPVEDDEEDNVSLIEDYMSLIDALRAAGAVVEPVGERDLDLPFSVEAQVIIVNGLEVFVLEYTDGVGADADAALVSADGYSIGTAMVLWIGTPHFYHAGELLVLYVGDSAAVTDVLEAVIGAQFAGG